MTAILRNESRKLVRGSALLAGIFAVFLFFFLSVFPGFAAEAELIEEAYPAFVIALLGFEQIHTIEGFVGGYIYPLVWVVFTGAYFAYLAAGMIAEDIETRRMDLTLSNPVSRESVIVQKLAALWVPLVTLSVGMIVMLSVGTAIIGETLDPLVLVMIHLLSIPYLFVCAGIGMLLSVVLDRVESAQAMALGLVFLLWLVDGMSTINPDFEWVGTVSPSRYFDSTEILLHEEYAFLDAGILLGGFLVLLGVAIFIFTRRDI